MYPHLEELSLSVKNNIEELYNSYDYSDRLMADAVKEAMPWVSLYMAGVSKPSNAQLVKLASQMLAIVLANNVTEHRKNAKLSDSLQQSSTEHQSNV